MATAPKEEEAAEEGGIIDGTVTNDALDALIASLLGGILNNSRTSIDEKRLSQVSQELDALQRELQKSLPRTTLQPVCTAPPISADSDSLHLLETSDLASEPTSGALTGKRAVPPSPGAAESPTPWQMDWSRGGDIAVDSLCRILELLMRILQLVIGSQTSEWPSTLPHLATCGSSDTRAAAVRVLQRVLDVYCWVSPILAKLLEGYRATRPPQKKIKREAQERYAERGRVGLKSLRPPVSSKGVFDNANFQIVRCLHNLFLCVGETATNNLVFFTDDWSPSVRHLAFTALGTIWKPMELLNPKGSWQVEVSPSWPSPLKQWTWLRTAIERLAGPQAQDVGDDRDSFIPPANSTRKEQGYYSLTMQRRIDADAMTLETMTSLVDNGKFCQNSGLGAHTIHGQMKILVANVGVLRGAINQTGWLVRGLEDPDPEVRLSAAQFLKAVFSHDRHSLATKEKFNLPVMDLLYDASDGVRGAIAEASILLSQQQPFKDGAFKRFEMLIHTRRRNLRSTAYTLLGSCPALNVAAIKEGFKALLNAADQCATDSTVKGVDELRGAIKAMVNLVKTNSEKAIDLMAVAVEALRLRFTDQSSMTPECPRYLTFAAYAAALVEHCPGSALANLPVSLIYWQPELRRRYPDLFSKELLVIPLQASAIELGIRSPPLTLIGRAVRQSGTAISFDLSRKFVEMKKSGLIVTRPRTEAIEIMGDDQEEMQWLQVDANENVSEDGDTVLLALMAKTDEGSTGMRGLPECDTSNNIAATRLRHVGEKRWQLEVLQDRKTLYSCLGIPTGMHTAVGKLRGRVVLRPWTSACIPPGSKFEGCFYEPVCIDLEED